MASSRIRVAALLLGCGLLIAGCVEDWGSPFYASVPLQIVDFEGERYEILDRPDVGRLTIAPCACGRLAELRARLGPYIHLPVEGMFRPGSSYLRTCRVLRGNPPLKPQWEFVYSCAPGYEPGTIHWHTTGFSAPDIPGDRPVR
jgi:hypothetical protein